MLCVVLGCGVSVWAEASATEVAAAAEQTAEVQTADASDVAADVDAEMEVDAEADAEMEADADAEAELNAAAEAESAIESQADLDAAHENAVATLESYAEKAHALRDEIIESEHSLMEQMASIDSCPPSELSGLMARAKKQITHLFQIKALYLAIKTQEKQLRALVDAGTGKRVPNIAPKTPAPAKPAKPAAAKPVASGAVNVDALATLNAKMVDALKRLETVTARLAVVERRQKKSHKATLLIAGQMEKDEKRLNKHSRVLRRVRSGVKKIKRSLKALAASCKRGRVAENRIARRGGKRGGKRAAKRGGKKAAKAAKKGRGFDVNACYAKCARRSVRRQSKCVRVCARKAATIAKRVVAKAAGKKVARRGRGRKGGKRARRASRSPALKRCLNKCRAVNRNPKLPAAKRCAIKCFRRHMHRGKRARKGRKGGRRVKKAKKFNLKKCLVKCQGAKSKGNRRRRGVKCSTRCYAQARAARARKGKGKRASNRALKKCFKTCRKGKKWNMKCVRACRAKHGKQARKGKGKGKGQNKAKLLKACFKTCRGKSRVVVRRLKNGKTKRVVVAGAWNMPCVRSCRKRFGPKAKRARKPKNLALQKCYNTCKKPAKASKGKRAGKRNSRRVQWDMKCVKRCRARFGKKKRAPVTAAYKACLARCRAGKGFAKCKKACAAHNRLQKLPKIKSPSRKAVAAAMKGLKKKKVVRKQRPETWEDVVRQSRRLLKKTVKLRNLVHKQVAKHFDTEDVEGRKYNGWWSIYDVLKSIKPGKHFTGRAKEIDADVRQILAPALARAEDGPYGDVVAALKGADAANPSKYTRELGSPALDLSVDPKFSGYVEKPLPGARIRHVPYNPVKPYDPAQHTWHKTPPLSRLPELVDEDYNENLSPIYARQFKVTPRKTPEPQQPFDLKTKTYDYPQIPYSYPVTMVSHDPRYNNPHVRPATPGFHPDWPEFRFQQTATSADAADAAAAPAPAPEAAQEQPMTEGTA